MQLFRVLGMSMFCDLQRRKEISHIYVDSDRGDLGFSLFFVFFIFSFFFFFLITVIETGWSHEFFFYSKWEKEVHHYTAFSALPFFNV